MVQVLILASNSWKGNPALGADRPHLSWLVGYLGMPWGEETPQKPLCKAGCHQIARC